jgi:hypothetical protein
MFRLLVAGEYAIAGQALLHDIIDNEEKGTRIDFVKPEGRRKVFSRSLGRKTQARRRLRRIQCRLSLLVAGLIQVEEHRRQ